MKKITFLITAFILSFNATNGQIVFDFETATMEGPAGGQIVTETKEDITVNVSASTVSVFTNSTYGDLNYGGVTGISARKITNNTDAVTITFSEAVDVHSVLVLEASFADLDWTFSTTDGTNAPKTISFTNSDGIADESPVILNWEGVTTFTVTPTREGLPAGSGMLFDDLIVTASSLGVADRYKGASVQIYPNPVQNTLYIKNTTGLRSVQVYNSLGQQVLKGSTNQLDVDHLPNGLYFLKIQTDNGTATKRIIKK